MGTRVPAAYITGAQSGLGDWSSVWVGTATMPFFFSTCTVFIWPRGIREAYEDLKVIKGPFLTLHDVAELWQKPALRRQTHLSGGRASLCLAPGGSLCAPHRLTASAGEHCPSAELLRVFREIR